MAAPLGPKLKNARELRGLTLQDAAHETRIPAARLQQLEQDNYAAFGSMTYARGFLKIYSRYLWVDAGEMLDELPGGVLGGARDYRYLTESHGPWVGPRHARMSRLSTPAHRPQSRRSPVHAGLAIFVLLLVGTGIWGKYVADERQAPPPAVGGAQAATAAAPRVPQVQAVPHQISSQTGVVPGAAALPPAVLKAIPVTPEELRIFRPDRTGAGKALPVE